jgi:hypothetical protein
LKTELAKKIKKISIFVRSVNFPPHLKGGGGKRVVDGKEEEGRFLGPNGPKM